MPRGKRRPNQHHKSTTGKKRREKYDRGFSPQRPNVFVVVYHNRCAFASTSPIARGVATTRLLRIFALSRGGGGGGVGRHVPTARRCCGATPRFSRMASENTMPPPIFSSSRPPSAPPPSRRSSRFQCIFFNEFFSAFTRTTLNVDENQGPPFEYFNDRPFQCRIGDYFSYAFLPRVH